jgi:starch synthase
MSRDLHVAFLATECAPFVKVGGLADVIGALPARLASLGVRVSVVIPRFGEPSQVGRVRPLARLPVPLGSQTPTAEIHTVDIDESRVRVFLIADEQYFPRKGLYVDPASGRDYSDQLQRWCFFQRASLELLARESSGLDVVHCHEHQTALVPAYIDAIYRKVGVFEDVGTVFTVHNLGYQGSFPVEDWSKVGLDDGEIRPGGRFEYYGRINLMKGGLLTSDSVTVVSPNYAQEIQTPEYGCGLDGVIVTRNAVLTGILNGIDESVWNPATDSLIPARYTSEDRAGKSEDRKALLEEFGLGPAFDEGPVLAMVSRIDAHKGFDLLIEILDDLLHEPLRFILLGTGDPEIQRSMEEILTPHPGKAALHFGFDDAMAHRIIAGADIFLMPSRYEPCGLTQMYAMRYGTVPVVRATGGLVDTVDEFDPETGEGTGFLFGSYDANEFRAAIDRARKRWSDRESWEAIVRNGMARDFSWDASARKYLQIYEDTLGRRNR